MVGWHHGLNEHEFEQTPGDSEGRGSLAGCSPRGLKELDRTKRLKTTQQCKATILKFKKKSLIKKKVSCNGVSEV